MLSLYIDPMQMRSTIETQNMPAEGEESIHHEDTIQTDLQSRELQDTVVNDGVTRAGTETNVPPAAQASEEHQGSLLQNTSGQHVLENDDANAEPQRGRKSTRLTRSLYG